MKLTLNCLVVWIIKTRGTGTNPNELQLQPLHSHRVTVLSGISAFGINRRYLFIFLLRLQWPLSAMCIRWMSFCCHSNAIVTQTLLPSGLNNLEQQHILIGSRYHLKNCVWTSHSLTLWRHFLASSFARCRLVNSFCGVSDMCGRLRLHNLREFLTKSMPSHQPCYFA